MVANIVSVSPVKSLYTEFLALIILIHKQGRVWCDDDGVATNKTVLQLQAHRKHGEEQVQQRFPKASREYKNQIIQVMEDQDRG